MNIGGVAFENVFLPSGTLNFEKQGWPHHKLLRPIPGFSCRGATFVAKTTTYPKRDGHMPLDPITLMPKKMFSDCVYVDFRKGLVLNSVNLSGPGAEVLFARGKWYDILENFFLSFMTVAETKEERIVEVKKFAALLRRKLPRFKAKVGLKLNITCDNTGHNLLEMENEALWYFEILSELGIPLGIKINVMTSAKTVKRIMDSGYCHAIFLSNTIKWGKLPDRINWQELFGTTISPLYKYGGGSLSGWPVLPLVKEWVMEARDIGIDGIIVGGNGISHRKHIDFLYPLLDGYSIGSSNLYRPWRWQDLINYANQKIAEKQRSKK